MLPRVFPGVPFTSTHSFILSPVIFSLRPEITNVSLHAGCHNWIITMLGNTPRRKAGVFFFHGAPSADLGSALQFLGISGSAIFD